jgi:hypothetical protein
MKKLDKPLEEAEEWQGQQCRVDGDTVTAIHCLDYHGTSSIPILCQYFFHSFNLVIVTFSGKDFAIGAGADTKVSRYARRAFEMNSGMTIVNSLGDLRPRSFWRRHVSITEQSRIDHEYSPMFVP